MATCVTVEKKISMSLFEDLKIQAQKMLEPQSSSASISAEEMADRNVKLKETYHYWREFAELIKVIKPDFSDPIHLATIGDMTDMKISNPYSDYRLKTQMNQNFYDEIDYVTMYFFYKAPQEFSFKKEVGALTTRVKDLLWRHGIVHTARELKNKLERVVEVDFNIPWQVKGSVTVTPLAQSRILHFSLKNIGKLGEVEFEIPFEKINIIFLDELSKLMMGQDNRFWKLVKS